MLGLLFNGNGALEVSLADNYFESEKDHVRDAQESPGPWHNAPLHQTHILFILNGQLKVKFISDGEEERQVGDDTNYLFVAFQDWTGPGHSSWSPKQVIYRKIIAGREVPEMQPA